VPSTPLHWATPSAQGDLAVKSFGQHLTPLVAEALSVCRLDCLFEIVTTEDGRLPKGLTA
jgi:hypothetical protein